MTRFYFHCRDGDRWIRDHDGVELAAIADAGMEGRRALAEMAADAASDDWGHPLTIVITTAGDVPLMQISLTFAQNGFCID